MTKLVSLLLASLLALGGGTKVHNSFGDYYYCIKNEQDIDTVVYETCMYIMENYDYETSTIAELLDAYQALADDESVSVETRAEYLEKSYNAIRQAEQELGEYWYYLI